MAYIETTAKGFVSVKELSEAFKNTDNYAVIQYLEDGVSYLNYANSESNMGNGNVKEDLETGLFFINCAFDILVSKAGKERSE